jgi:hypothetical protein
MNGYVCVCFFYDSLPRCVIFADGNTVGAVGVSGAAADEDEYLAWQGVKSVSEAAGLKTVPEEHSCTTLKN